MFKTQVAAYVHGAAGASNTKDNIKRSFSDFTPLGSSDIKPDRKTKKAKTATTNCITDCGFTGKGK